jgi:hypothetical protein
MSERSSSTFVATGLPDRENVLLGPTADVLSSAGLVDGEGMGSGAAAADIPIPRTGALGASAGRIGPWDDSRTMALSRITTAFCSSDSPASPSYDGKTVIESKTDFSSAASLGTAAVLNSAPDRTAAFLTGLVATPARTSRQS